MSATAPPAAADDAEAPALPPLPRRAFIAAWAVFWLLMGVVELEENFRRGGTDLWRPLLWAGSSCLVASVIVLLHWHRAGRSDALLPRPARWFAAQLAWLPLVVPGFVVAVYALRHAVHALLGLDYRHEPWARVFGYEGVKFAIFYLLFVAVVFGIRAHAAMNAERWRAERARSLQQRAQLLQLAQQIEPHFLFNALNTITETVHTDAALADRLLTRLAALLRAATDLARRPEVPLADELALLEGYAEIMLARFGDRVQLQWQVDEAARACRVPSLALQPLLENAFRHGVERKPGPVAIVVSARLDGGRLRLAVDDDAGALPAPPVFGVGLGNLRERLAAAHGAQASLALRPRPGGGVRAEMVLPCAC